ncbi:uncharacterized protein [Littorina saxatilis]|uniref:Uncharacterized protein n=1 Tax=Littorina saxatilis TaxID=31220 RepID=A0AAN9G0B4_9CAEN
MGSETRSTRSKTYKKELEDYDHRFTEIEYRALRAYLMNYSESAYFDWWSAKMVILSTCLFVVAILGGSYFLYQKEFERTGTILGSLLSSSGVLRWLATGQTEFLPSLDARAQKHVNAGAEMTRIHRLAKLYRSQLRTGAAPTDSTRWETQYKELLSAYKEASSYSVIREKAYQKYNTVELVCTEQRKRKDQVTEYLDAIKAQTEENNETNN